MPMFRKMFTVTVVIGFLLVAWAPNSFSQCKSDEVLVGEDADNYYCEKKAKIKKPSQTAKAKAGDVAYWSGNWDQKEKALVNSTLGGLKDKKIRNWMTANVRFERRDDPGQQNMISPWASDATLIFNDYFFSRNTSNARRENLITFEAGKAFWLHNVAGNGALNSWFINYHTQQLPVIERLAKAKHQKEDLSFIYDKPQEMSSAFGYLFRAQALGLKLDKTSQKEFELRIAPFLRAK